MPSPQGTEKVIHQAAMVGQAIKHSNVYGWLSHTGEPLGKQSKHCWETMIRSVQSNIESSNFKNRIALLDKGVKYIRSSGSLVDSHTIQLTDKNKVATVTSKQFIIANSKSPKLPDECEGVHLAITSDDLLSLPNSPGKTVVVGESYIALECAGFLNGLGLETVVMARSILLHGFDHEFVEKICEHMVEEGVKFQRACVPKKIELICKEPRVELQVIAKCRDGRTVVENCNTVLFAIGRQPCTENIGLERLGATPNIYTLGDYLNRRSELMPVSIEAGLLLANRLFSSTSQQCVPTTILTPLEYGCVGLTEEEAIAQYGTQNLKVYIQNSTPFEWTIAHHLDNKCYAKLITVLNENQRVVGFHFLGPNAGEITQFVGLALKKNATKAEFDSLIGIHPTCAEVSVVEVLEMIENFDGCLSICQLALIFDC